MVERPNINVRGEKKTKRKRAIKPQMFTQMIPRMLPRSRTTIATKAKPKSGNAWNSKKGQSAVTALFGSSTKRKLKKSSESKTKGTDQRAQNKEVAVKKEVPSLNRQGHSAVIVNAGQNTKAMRPIVESVTKMEESQALKSNDKTNKQSQTALQPPVYTKTTESTEEIRQRPQRIAEKRPIIRNREPYPVETKSLMNSRDILSDWNEISTGKE